MAATDHTVDINPYALRLVRRLRNLKQATIAVEAEISPSFLSELESGRKPRVSRETLDALMRALQLEPDDERAITRYRTLDELRAERECTCGAKAAAA